jgi:hypothetical protein
MSQIHHASCFQAAREDAIGRKVRTALGKQARDGQLSSIRIFNSPSPTLRSTSHALNTPIANDASLNRFHVLRNNVPAESPATAMRAYKSLAQDQARLAPSRQSACDFRMAQKRCHFDQAEKFWVTAFFADKPGKTTQYRRSCSSMLTCDCICHTR